MIYLIIVFLGSAFWCIGFRSVIIEVVIINILSLDFEKFWDEISTISRLILKPLFGCPYCMASVHGTIIYYILLAPIYGFFWWPVFCIVLCGFIYFLTQFFNE